VSASTSSFTALGAEDEVKRLADRRLPHVVATHQQRVVREKNLPQADASEVFDLYLTNLHPSASGEASRM
jgi:hypothetical protein